MPLMFAYLDDSAKTARAKFFDTLVLLHSMEELSFYNIHPISRLIYKSSSD
jgi:hypothetical protein